MTIAEQIAGLTGLSTAELAAEYERLHGKAPRLRHPSWLRKRIAYRLQENAYGGLPGPARAEIERLAADLRLPDAAPGRRPTDDDARGPNGKPQPGTVLQREWRGQQIRVEVLPDGFAWNGDRYGSLSAVARAVTGARWNGRLFFGLTQRTRA
ncbi:MAG: DUF2924 domain-containing protein [Gaiellales bacterium]